MSLFNLLMVSGCSENQLYGEEAAPFSPPNPPDLETVPVTDSYTQNKVNNTDVLFIIDNSSSMDEEQVAMTASFNNFVHYFMSGSFSPHIGVVSTDTSYWGAERGQLHVGLGFSYIDENTPDELAAMGVVDEQGNPADVIDVFSDMMLPVGTAGGERGIDATDAALNDWNAIGQANYGFFREDANKHFILISDEKDQSLITTPEELIQELNELKIPIETAQLYGAPLTQTEWQALTRAEKNALTAEAEDNVGFHSIVDTTTENPLLSGAAYVQVSEGVGGLVWPIHVPNYSPMMTALGMDISGITDEFFLSEIPVVNSISVDNELFDPVTRESLGITIELLQDEEWVYNQTRNSIKIIDPDFIPDPFSQVHITYDALSTVEP